MSPSLLTTKLTVPTLRPNLVPRPRLVQRLEEGRRWGRRLTLVSAPAGYGKTTLVVEWIHGWDDAAGRPQVAWLALDRGDNDTARFFAYLVAALQTVEPGLGRVVTGLLQAPRLPAIDVLVTELINDVAASPASCLLVLDDYHAIHQVAIHQAVGLLLERQPSNLHLAITTRQDPPLPVSRLRGRDMMTEIREQDLCFTLEEAAAFVHQTMDLDLTPDNIAVLAGRTEGWVTGLQMASIALRSQLPDPAPERAARFIASFSGRHHFVLDYLADEVFKSRPAAVQDFLLQTSVLDQLSAPLCEAVTGMPEAQQMLEYLDVENLFVVPLDDERHWYRYHYLFADLLQARLQETRPAQIPELHARAAAWWEQNDSPVEAVQHILASGDLAQAAATIQRCVERIETWSHVDGATFLGWIQALPREMLRQRPRLRQFEARALYATGQTAAAERALHELEQDLQAGLGQAPAGNLLPGVEADRASFAVVRGHVPQAIEYANRALARLPDGETSFRTRLTGILALAALRAGEVGAAERDFRQVIARVCEQGMAFAAVPLVCNLAQVQMLQGRLLQAYETFRQALEMSTVDGDATSATGFAHLGLAQVQYEWDELQGAEQQVRQGLDQLQRAHIPASFGSGYALLAQIRQALGDLSGARESMRRAVRLAQASDIPRLELLASAQQARLWLRQGELDLAAQWARDYARAAPAPYLREFEDLTLARVRLAQAGWEAARDLLDSLLAAAQTAGRGGSVVEIQALRGWALAGDRGPDSHSLEALTQALQAAQPEGYVRLFADEGPPLARLLYEVAKRDVAPDYVRRLLAAGDQPGVAVEPLQPSGKAPAALVEPLTGREQEVLQLLAAGLSNAEIAQRLFISLPTVKSHTGNLYGKLGVHSRQEAVDQARVLGLLPPA